MIRFANKRNLQVVGGASRLFKHFLNNVCVSGNVIVSYADRRHSKGKLYEALGFELSHKSSPNYFYTKNFQNILSRISCQKHKLRMLLDNYDEEMSEYQNMVENGYYRIFDCGNLVYRYKV